VNLDAGQIWLIDFDPSFGHEYQKVRPALIVENARYIKSGSLITVIPISSATDKFVDLDVSIPSAPVNRLLKDSLVKTRQISSFDKRRLVKSSARANPRSLPQFATLSVATSTCRPVEFQPRA
jgi:mRNA interferase MazF